MSKGCRGSAANVLMLKKNEDKREDKRQETALSEALKKADINKDGRLRKEDYHKILQDSGSTREEIVNMMEKADKNGDGFVTRAEMKVDKSKGGGLGTEKTAERAFSLMDRNNDGFITKQEMLNTTSKLTEKQVSAVFNRNDKDGDGKLSKQEFKDMMMKEKKLIRNDSDMAAKEKLIRKESDMAKEKLG